MLLMHDGELELGTGQISRQVLAHRGIPFDVKIPNKQTLKALENSRNRKNLTTYKNSDELFEDLGI
jgi:DNA-damage-inducible protein J